MIKDCIFCEKFSSFLNFVDLYKNLNNFCVNKRQKPVAKEAVSGGCV